MFESKVASAMPDVRSRALISHIEPHSPPSDDVRVRPALQLLIFGEFAQRRSIENMSAAPVVALVVVVVKKVFLAVLFYVARAPIHKI